MHMWTKKMKWGGGGGTARTHRCVPLLWGRKGHAIKMNYDKKFRLKSKLLLWLNGGTCLATVGGPQTVRGAKFKCSRADWGRAVKCVCGDQKNWGRWWRETKEYVRRDAGHKTDRAVAPRERRPGGWGWGCGSLPRWWWSIRESLANRGKAWSRSVKKKQEGYFFFFFCWSR